MPRQLKILKEDEWFLGRDGCDGYPVSYRYALCYSLRTCLETCDYDEIKGKTALNDLKNHITSGSAYRENRFVELLPLRDGGFVVVDQADGMFPLVLYPDRRSDTDHCERVSAYLNSVNEVYDKYEVIFRYLRAHRTEQWDQDFQKNLWASAGFAYPVNSAPSR